MKAVAITGSGEHPADLALADVPKPDLEQGFALVRTRFAGVNRPDILQRRGLYPPPPGASPILGLEVSGTIEAIHPSIPYGAAWEVGDEVCALVNGGGYAEYVAVDIRHLLPVPKGVSLEVAGALPETVLTVYANLMEHGALKAGETVLVHGANSGIGSMTVQMGKAFGANVIATARGAENAPLPSLWAPIWRLIPKPGTLSGQSRILAAPMWCSILLPATLLQRTCCA